MKKGFEASTGLVGLGLKALTSAEICDIHAATLEILQYTGIKVLYREALEVFAEGGADVDFVTGQVLIPGYMVEEAIQSAPSYVILAGRDPRHDVYLGGNRVHFSTFGAGCRVVDPYTGDVSEATKSDVGLSAV